MCPINGQQTAMPLDFDMLLSASPPNFGLGVGHHFPNSVVNSCGYKPSMKMHDYPVVGKKTHLHLNSNGVNYSLHNYQRPESPKPGRSILVMRPFSIPFAGPDFKGVEISKSTSDHVLEKHRKHVCFADDRGMALAHVKVMQEPSDYPPTIREDILASVAARGAFAKAEPDNIWELSFTQPASDYLKFREAVDKESVSLENVVLKDYQILGTIKVKNVSFEKKVFVRITFNNWVASVDVPATYVPSGVGGSTSYFDTFSFDITIPPETSMSNTIEFCIGYRADSSEFWDNNHGSNYKLVPVKQVEEEDSVLTPVSECHAEEICPYFHPYYETDDFGEFASWKDIDDSLPYW